MTDIDQQRDANSKLKYVKQILGMMPPSFRNMSGSRRIFDQSIYRDIIFQSHMPFAFIEIAKCVDLGLGNINIGFYTKRRDSLIYTISYKVIQELYMIARQKNPQFNHYICYIFLENFQLLNMLRSFGFKTIQNENLAKRNKLNMTGNYILLMV